MMCNPRVSLHEGSMTGLTGICVPPTDERYMVHRSCSVDTLRALPGQKVVILPKAHRPPKSSESRERGYSQRIALGDPCEILNRAKRD